MPKLFIPFFLATLTMLTGCPGSQKVAPAGAGGAGPSPSFVRRAAGTSSNAASTQFTVLLFSAQGPGHAQTVAYYKEQTEKNTGWGGLFAVHEADASALYWGTFASVDAASDSLKKARTYRTRIGAYPFGQALVVPLPGEDVGPPEWNLLKAKGAYTVLVAVYFDDPKSNYVGRKSFAVECCRQLRQQGYEAYYYHGPAKSHVTIGTFPDQSIELVQDDKAVRQEIRDQRITEILNRFPQLSVNDVGVIETLPIRDERGMAKRAVVKTMTVRMPSNEQEDSFGGFGHAQPR